MTNDSSKIIYWGIGVLVVVIVAVGGFFVWQYMLPTPVQDTSTDNTTKTQRDQQAKTVVAPSTGKELIVEGVPTKATTTSAVSAKGAYDVLLIEAKKWREDAVLANLKSDKDAALDGKSSIWEAHFISKSDLKKGWTAILKDGAIGEGKEEETNAKTIIDPPFTVDSGDAIKAGLGDLGATEVKVSSIKLFQETQSGEWFWSIATDKGNVTLIAR